MLRHAVMTTAAMAALHPPVYAEEIFGATLAGHAFLPALTLVTPPADAPRDA